MFRLQVWEVVVTAGVALVSLGWMACALVRLFSRRAAARAVVRRATPFESGLVSGTMPKGVSAFDGWAYRVGARFAGRVRVVIYPDRVAVAGPRVARGLYEAWMWAQGLLLALVPPALAAAIVAWEWRWLLVGLATFVLSFGISIGGAGLWPGLGELEAIGAGGCFRALEFPRTSVREVTVGKGWAKGGLEVVLFPYKPAVDRMAAGRAVSFFAPDEYGREVRFAVHMYSDQDAQELSARLAR
ncbi:MAG: hypothetical protein ACP5SI_07895 [Chloroflexia bacterium]